MTKPIILYPGKYDEESLAKLKQDNEIWQISDIYDLQLSELAEISHPGDKLARGQLIDQLGEGDLAGAWVYYPWSGVLLHCLGDSDLFALRTNRNKNLITASEQGKLANSSLAVAGMSVGSSAALACVYSGMSNSIKIADFDTLETANLNRLREALTSIGVAKAELTARHIWELNPFAEVNIFEHGLDAKNIDDFFSRTSIVIDEIDDFKIKVRLRLRAKQFKIPLLMFTSLGDNILVDVERYDLNPELAIFNGAIGDVPEEILAKKDITSDDAKKYAVKLVGQEYVPTRAMASLAEIGKSLVGRPQLYSTIAVDGGLAAYVVKMILLGEGLQSGRYFIKFDELFGLTQNDISGTAERRETRKKLFGDD